MIHVFVLLDGFEYKLHDAKYDKSIELWTGEVVGRGVEIGINPRLIRIVYFFKSAADYDAFQHGNRLENKADVAGSRKNIFGDN